MSFGTLGRALAARLAAAVGGTMVRSGARRPGDVASWYIMGTWTAMFLPELTKEPPVVGVLWKTTFRTPRGRERGMLL